MANNSKVTELSDGQAMNAMSKFADQPALGEVGSPQRLQQAVNAISEQLPQISEREFSDVAEIDDFAYQNKLSLADISAVKLGLNPEEYIPKIGAVRIRMMDEIDIVRLTLATVLTNSRELDMPNLWLSFLQRKSENPLPRHDFTTTGLELEIIRGSDDILKTWRTDAKIIDLLTYLGIQIGYDGLREIRLPYSDVLTQIKAIEELYQLGVLQPQDALGVHLNYGLRSKEAFSISDPSPILLQFLVDSANLFEIAENHPEAVNSGEPICIAWPRSLTNSTSPHSDRIGLPIRLKYSDTVVEFRSIPLVTDVNRFARDLAIFSDMFELMAGALTSPTLLAESLRLTAKSSVIGWSKFYSRFEQLLIHHDMGEAGDFLANYSRKLLDGDTSLSRRCNTVRGKIVHQSAKNTSFRNETRALINEVLREMHGQKQERASSCEQ